MILPFININRRILVIMLFILTGVFFSCNVFSIQKNIFYLPNNMGQIFWECEHDLCNTYLKARTERMVIISKKSSSPSIDALNENLVKLFFSCGSPCNHTIFYDAKIGVSRSFEFVVAVDSKREIVVITENNHLIAYKIFGNAKEPLFSVKKDWSPTATLFSNIIEAKFVNDGFYIKYLEGKDFHEKEEIINGVCAKQAC